jgi:hypothetical protein
MTNKKVFLGFLIGLVFAASLSADVDWKEYPGPLQENKLFINAGIGFGPVLSQGEMTVPPIQVSVDYVLPLGGIPFTVGGMFGFSKSEWDYGGYVYTYTGLAFGARLSYHPNVGVENLDPYATLIVGYYSYKGESSAGATGDLDLSVPLWGFDIGARYFFTPMIGAYAELGWTSLSYVSVGITLKFL